MALTPTPLDPLHVQAVMNVDTDGNPTAGTLPTGAATAAKQPALGTAGTPSTDVITVQGITAGTPLPVIGVSGGQPLPLAGSTANTVMSSTNPFSVNLTNGANAAAITTGGDALAGSTAGLLTKSITSGWNGSTADRFRTIQGAKSVSTGVGVTAVEYAGRPSAHITTAATTTPVSGAGIIEGIDISTLVASATITVYDSLTASGTVLGVMTLPSVITEANPIMDWLHNRAFATGLTIVTSGATDVNVCYRN